MDEIQNDEYNQHKQWDGDEQPDQDNQTRVINRQAEYCK